MAVAAAVTLAAQSVSVVAAAGVIAIRAPSFGFIEREVLDHLRDGRSVKVGLELSVLATANGPVVTHGRQEFNISFDLWEERFVVTRLGQTPRSLAHLTARAAEAWCLENVVVPQSAMLSIGPDTPFWIRLESRVQLPEPVPAPAESGLGIARLIDAFSRRPADGDRRRTIAAGPLRVKN